MVPRARVGKQAALLLILPVFAASCGGSGGTTQAAVTRLVSGPGFRFEVPQGWRPHQVRQGIEARPAPGSGVLVSARTFRLLRSYAPADFPAASDYLDGVAARLARNAGGKLTASETTTVAGRRIRSYGFTSKQASGGSYRNRIGFVLRGRTEVQLLCRAPAGEDDPDGACALLYESFTLAS